MESDVIDQLILNGLTNSEIAKELGVSMNTVKSRRTRKKKQIAQKRKCLYCGSDFSEVKKGRHRNFCSDKCRWDYWNTNKKHTEYAIVCMNCGAEFISNGNPKKRFCCRKCYHEYERNK